MKKIRGQMEPQTDRARMMAVMQAEYTFVQRTLNMLTADEMLMPNVVGWWSVKDTLAHLTAWMEYLIGWFDQARQGVVPDIPAKGMTWDDVDRLNDDRSARDADLPLKQVVMNFGIMYAQVCSMLDGLSDSDLFESTWNGVFYQPPWPLIPSNVDEHFHLHFLEVRQWMAARG